MKLRRLALTLVATLAVSISVAGQTVTPPTTTPPSTTAPTVTRPGTMSPTAPVPVRTTQPVASTPQLGARIGTISGLIVSAMDGRPLPRVAVRLNGHGVAQTRLTDDKGRVTFADLPPGDFTINATKTGFFDGSYGKRRASGTGMPLSLPPGVSIPDMRIELFRPAVISGFVFDEVGEPVIGTRVVALRRQFIDGRWRVTLIGEQTTDDEGSYRIFGLMPGDYFVSVPIVQVSAAIETFEEIARTGSAAGGVAAFLTPFMNSTSGLSGLDQNRFVFDADDRHVMIASPATPPDAENGRAFAYPTVYHPAAEAVESGTRRLGRSRRGSPRRQLRTAARSARRGSPASPSTRTAGRWPTNASAC